MDFLRNFWNRLSQSSPWVRVAVASVTAGIAGDFITEFVVPANPAYQDEGLITVPGDSARAQGKL